MTPPEDQPSGALPHLPDLPGLDPVTPVPSRPRRPSLVVEMEQEQEASGEVRVPISEATGVAPMPPPGMNANPGAATVVEPVLEDDPYLGKSFGGYFLERRIGQGGMGLVYRGRQMSLDRVVAVKILNKQLCDNQEFIKRFEREAKSIARINHPNIVAVYDFGVHDALWYMVTEFVEGKSMSVMIGERLVLPLAEVVPIMIGALSGLDHVGLSGIVHRDIKPDNLLITRDGVAKLADFGLAKDVSERDDRTDLTAVGLAMGTPAYMSPEQCMGRRLDGRSDQYALGVTAYFALTGQKPFTGQSSFEIMTKQREFLPPPPHQVNPSIPTEVSAVILRMMAKDPADRFPDAGTCRQAWVEAGAAGSVPTPKLRSGEWEIPPAAAPRRQSVGSSTVNSAPAEPPVVHPPGGPVQNGPGLGGLPPLPVPPAAVATTSADARRASEIRRLSSQEQSMLRRAGTEPELPLVERALVERGNAERTNTDRAGTERSPAPAERRPLLASGQLPAATCPKCGMLNRTEALSCSRCAAPLRGGDPQRQAKDQEAEAGRHLEQGRNLEAAAIFARLADQEQDRRAKSVLRAREREARRADLERQLQDCLARGRALAERGDLRGGIEILSAGRALFGDHQSSAATSSVLGSVQGALEAEIHDLEGRVADRRRLRLILLILLVIGVVGLVAWLILRSGGAHP